MLEFRCQGDWHKQIANKMMKTLEEQGEQVSYNDDKTVTMYNRIMPVNKIIHITDIHGNYKIINFKDMVAIQRDSVMRAATIDPLCTKVLKAQYRHDFYDEKIVPFTYYEKDPDLYQSLLPELRKTPKTKEKLYFRGSGRVKRRHILEKLKHILPENKILDIKNYYLDCADYKIGLALPGNGNICHREIEYFGMGTTVIMPKLKNTFHNPLIPNFHYISIDVDTTKDNHETISEAIWQTYESVLINNELIEEIAKNAMTWYDHNVKFPNSINLALELL